MIRSFLYDKTEAQFNPASQKQTQDVFGLRPEYISIWHSYIETTQLVRITLSTLMFGLYRLVLKPSDILIVC